MKVWQRPKPNAPRITRVTELEFLCRRIKPHLQAGLDLDVGGCERFEGATRGGLDLVFALDGFRRR